MVRVFVFHGTPSPTAKRELAEFMTKMQESIPFDKCIAAVIDTESSTCYQRILSAIDSEEDVTVQPMLLFRGKHYQELLDYVKVYETERSGKVFMTDTISSLGKVLAQDPIYEVQDAPWSTEAGSTKFSVPA